MLIEENHILKEKLLEKLKGSEGVPKTFHVTELVGCLRKPFFLRKGIPQEKSEKSVLAKKLGSAIHELLPFAIKEVVVEKDGVVGHIDAIWDRITELKTTSRRVSVKQILQDTNYLKQIKAYCYMRGEKEADLVIFRVSTKTLECYTLKFSDEELEENWRQILENKKHLEYCLENDVLPKKGGGICEGCEYEQYCRVVDE
jgi:CRISPR/Cas system-associated exonuclease Cas4 (RecB family)